jgi:hypothetical protein
MNFNLHTEWKIIADQLLEKVPLHERLTPICQTQYACKNLDYIVAFWSHFYYSTNYTHAPWVNHTFEHRFATEIGQWLTTPIPRGNQLCHFCCYNVVENETHFVLDYSLYYTRDRFASLFQNDVEDIMTSCFQLDHQVDNILHLVYATTIR